MSINSPVIASGPTQLIAKTFGSKVRIIPVEPGETYRTVVDGAVTEQGTDPSAHGELIIQRIPATGGSVMVLYVAVDVDGTLSWKKAKVLSGVDRYSRRPVDRFIT